jgi:thiol-disulfide isomerase/thioredoxin
MAHELPSDQPEQSPAPKSPPIGILTLITLLVGLWVVWSIVAPMLRPQPEVHRGVGQTLLFLELAPLTGDAAPLSASDLQGHVTLLNIWGTWCPPCRAELPHVAELWRRLANREAFQLAAISYPPGGRGGDWKSLHDETTTLLKNLDLDLPTYYDANSKTLAAVDQVIGFEGFPTTVLLDRQGVIRAIWVGYEPGVETQIESFVDKLLNEPDKEQERP